MRVLVASLFLAFAGCASAQVLGFGGCPDVRPVDDLDTIRFSGRWYEIARFYSSYEVGVSCLIQEYTSTGLDRILSVTTSGVDREGTNFAFEDSVTQEQPGRLDFSSDDWEAYIIAAVNYDDYAWIHGCKEYFWGMLNVQYNWVLAREPMRSENDNQIIMEYLTSNGINVEKFIMTNQRDCESRKSATDGPDTRTFFPRE